jgi:ribosomal protein L11 methyltransferase
MFKVAIITEEKQQEILIALLSGMEYEGFEQDGNILKAFIPSQKFNEERLSHLSKQYQFSYIAEDVPEINWNATWEANFQPVTVGQFCGIRADFHQPLKSVAHEIIITPKMSFGTGHHATTFLMIQQMQYLNFKDKTVLDFGTGTGILGILTIRLGAQRVVAIDHDDWAIENARENCIKNHVQDKMNIEKTGTVIPDQYHIILANINRNILLQNLFLFAKFLIPGGILLMSGLLAEDESFMLKAGKEAGWEHLNSFIRDDWMALQWSR